MIQRSSPTPGTHRRAHNCKPAPQLQQPCWALWCARPQVATPLAAPPRCPTDQPGGWVGAGAGWRRGHAGEREHERTQGERARRGLAAPVAQGVEGMGQGVGGRRSDEEPLCSCSPMGRQHGQERWGDERGSQGQGTAEVLCPKPGGRARVAERWVRAAGRASHAPPRPYNSFEGRPPLYSPCTANPCGPG